MTIGILLKTAGVWLVMVVLAILNAGIRENVLTPAIGETISLPVSGITLSALIFAAAYVAMPFFGPQEQKTYVMVGCMWAAFTVAFEFLFGHYVMGREWHDIMQVLNIGKGDLFLVALLVTVMSPWLAAKVRGLL